MRLAELPKLSARACVHILPVSIGACVPLRQPSFFAFVEFDQFSVLSTQAAASCFGARFLVITNKAFLCAGERSFDN